MNFIKKYRIECDNFSDSIKSMHHGFGLYVIEIDFSLI